MKAKTEIAHVQLVIDMSNALTNILNPLAGKKASGLNLYIFPLCRFIESIAQGFLTLKQSGNHQAARVLIRTSIEASLKIAAVFNEPTILHRIAFTEYLGDKKLLKAAHKGNVKVDLVAHSARCANDKKRIAKLFSGKVLKDTELQGPELSQKAKLESLYDFQFRLYCNYTHATLRYLVAPQEINPVVDYITIQSVLYAALVVSVKSFGASCPNLASYKDRVKALGDQAAKEVTEEKAH